MSSSNCIEFRLLFFYNRNPSHFPCYWRFDSLDEYEKVAGCYCVDAALLAQAKEKMTIMHPLPR